MIVQKYVCPLKKICLVQKKVWVRLLESCVKLWRGGRRSELHPHWSHLKITVTTAAHVRSKQCSACACACGNSGLVKRHILLHINIDQKLEWKKQLAPKNPKNSITSFSFRNKHSNITMNNVEKKVGWLEEKWERNSSSFLDAFSHLYKRVCPSVRQSVGPSVGPSVHPSIGPSVTHELKPCKSAIFDHNYYQYERGRILCRVYGLVFSFLPSRFSLSLIFAPFPFLFSMP